MRIYLDSIGCRLNQSEIEKISAQFRQAGHQIVASPTDADMVVVNTCAVTVEAASDSRQKIRQAQRAGSKQIVVTGCWATFDPDGAGGLAGVSHVIPNVRKSSLVGEVLPPEISLIGQVSTPQDGQNVPEVPLARQALPGIHQRTRAFIKVQDGCDNHCTFCLTRLVRGQSVSTKVDEVLKDIQSAELGGVQEIVLTGVQLGAWGLDFDPPQRLSSLVRTILHETKIARLRLSSIEPWNLDDSFYALWDDPRLCRHLHLPLQSGSAATLKRMARKITPEEYAGVIRKLRSAVPEIALTTDILVGFPGESEEEFSESYAFIKQMAFAGGHVFTYSPRPQTAAERLPDPVAHKVRKARNVVIRDLLAEAGEIYRKQQVGLEMEVLWETAVMSSKDRWECEGLTGNYIRVSSTFSENMWNRLSRVRLTGLTPGGMTGEGISPGL